MCLSRSPGCQDLPHWAGWSSCCKCPLSRCICTILHMWCRFLLVSLSIGFRCHEHNQTKKKHDSGVRCWEQLQGWLFYHSIRRNAVDSVPFGQCVFYCASSRTLSSYRSSSSSLFVTTRMSLLPTSWYIFVTISQFEDKWVSGLLQSY